MRRLRPRALALALAAASTSATAASGAEPIRLAVIADVLHVGDGTIRRDVVVLCEDGVVRAVSPRASTSLEGWPQREARHVLPGLVALLDAARLGDARSIEPEREGADLFNAFGETDPWLQAGVTALGIAPAPDRLVGGRGGVLRLAGAASRRQHVRFGTVHASLLPEALDPPLAFEPNWPVNVDSPLRPASPQRPHTTMAALAELRRLLAEARAGEGSEAFRQVIRGEVPLAVRAHRAQDLRKALDLGRQEGVRIVLDGATESWRLADEIAEAGALVVLDVAHAGSSRSVRPERGEWRPDTPAILAAAGVDIALSTEDWGAQPDPLLLAGAAVRHGLDPELAIAAVTERAARAAGARDLGVVRPGARADLAAFDAEPLALRARPRFVVVEGEVAWDGADVDADEDDEVLVVRAGTIHSGANVHRDGTLTVRGGIVTGAGSGTAAPGGSTIRDFGPDAVVVPGFLDAFSLAGLEAGPSPGGSARLRAASAIELGEESLGHALAAGVTAALVPPPARGAVLGSAAFVSTAPRERPRPRDADAPDDEELEPSLDVVRADAGLVFFVDGGRDDVGPRAGRIKALKETLGKAKAHHERREKEGQDGKAKPPAAKGSGKDEAPKKAARKVPGPDRRRAVAAKKERDKPEKDLALDAFREIFTGKAPAFVVANRHDTILEALKAFQEVGVAPVLVGGQEADLVRDELVKREIKVILGAQVLRTDPGRLVNVAAELREVGVTVAFGSAEYGGAELLPLAVARAVRHGLSPEDALSGLTLSAAEAVRAPDGFGRLARGDRADFVVFSGDPFEPTSRVLAVAVRGRIVHEAEASSAAAGH